MEPDFDDLDKNSILEGYEIEPIEHTIVALPITDPVREVMHYTKEKDDGFFAVLTPDKGENKVEFYRGMADFFGFWAMLHFVWINTFYLGLKVKILFDYSILEELLNRGINFI